MTEDVVILCGGRGTRLREHTESIPKPLVEIGGRPILWHVIQIYALQGFRHFLLCLGHRGDMIEQFVGDALPDGLSIHCLDTGEDTPTGGRIALAAGELRGHRFCATYADGVADVDLRGLLAYHRDRRRGDHDRRAAGVPVRRHPARRRRAGDRFEEKPRFEHWINGGFFCFEPGVLDYLNDDCVLEREPLERLAADGQLRAYRHTGFWDCMDTYKDAVQLNDLWRPAGPPGSSGAEGTPGRRAKTASVTRTGTTALTLSDEIRQRFDEFSRSQKDVGQYIVDHLDEAAFHTAEELARRANTSSSTVVRFAQALGFEGFPELQAAARDEYRRARENGPPRPSWPRHRSSPSTRPSSRPRWPPTTRTWTRPPARSTATR